ncbi:MAG: universal stress protein, partial [Thermoleophilaceae bacterium]|nr:universal stress protein [Thermoleophilaceae bacterium]
MGRDASCIVVGYDGSPSSRAALAHAARVAADGGTVVVVTAFEPPPDWMGHPFDQRMLDEHRGKAEAALSEAAADPSLAGANVVTELIAGPPAEAIARVA